MALTNNQLIIFRLIFQLDNKKQNKSEHSLESRSSEHLH